MIQRSPDGQEYAFRGSFLEIERPSRIVQTFEFEPMPGHISTDAMTLTEVDGGTRLYDRFDIPVESGSGRYVAVGDGRGSERVVRPARGAVGDTRVARIFTNDNSGGVLGLRRFGLYRAWPRRAVMSSALG